MPGEFDVIARYFAPLAGEGALGLLDDAAVFDVPAGRQLVMAADAMVEGVHFLASDAVETVGRKLLRVNLSDLAAMGATPFGYLMTISVPSGTPETWFGGFAAGLALDQAEFGVRLLGGDTTSTPGPVSLSLTIIGHVAPGEAVTRHGARAGDFLWVTGNIGDGALGLRALRREVADPDGYLAGRYRLPRPRLGLALYGRATAAIDVSDGLVQDAGHLCRGVGVEIWADRVPLSAQARAAGADIAACCTGGDDYELLIAATEEDGLKLDAQAACLGFSLTCIGRFVAILGVRLLDREGKPIDLPRGGWQHF